MKVKRLHDSATLPAKAHAGDLGYDLFSAENAILYPGDIMLICTKIAIQFPEGYGGFIKDRSSVATKQKLQTVAGVIDNGYTGEISIALHNMSEQIRQVYVGDKIAQLVLIPTVNFEVCEVDEIVSSDGRHTAGFGSTGT
jgi:dUTP pyrophosphatase